MMNKKLDLSNKRMGEFLVGDLFNVKSGKALNYDKLIKNGHYPYVVRSTTNNGIREFMDYFDKSYLNKGNSISLGVDTSSYFYQKNNFFSGVKIKILYLLNYKLNKNIAMFLISVLNKQVSGYGYTGGKPFKEKDFKKEKISLPIKEDGTPDYEWMDQYINQLKETKEKKINNYLKKYNLKNSDLTEEETLFLKKWRDGSVQMGEFLVGDLFEIKLSKGDNKLSELQKGSIPLVSAGEKNQGIVGYIDNGDGISEKFNKNTITADMFGNVFLQSKDYYAVSHGRINILIPKHDFNINMLLYFVSIISKCVGNNRYGFSQMLTSRKLKEITLTLPIKEDGTPDYEAMEQYILIMKKLAVKKLNQKYNDTISKTEEVANNH